MNRYAPLIFLALTVVVQFIGMTFSFGLTQFGLPLSVLCLIHSLISGYLSFFFRMSKPWIFINLMIPAAILITSVFPGYGWVWLVLMLAFGTLYLPTYWTRVPYYPSSKKVYELVATLLPADREFKFIDIGCGNARLLAYLASRFPNGIFEGSDLSPSACIAAKFNCRRFSNIKISLGNYWKKSFSDYDFIYAFLSPTPMPEIQTKAKSEMKSGSCLLVNSFALPDLIAEKSIEINHNNQTELHLYRF